MNRKVNYLDLLKSGKLMDFFGRKTLLIASHLVNIAGWIVIAAASSVAVVCFGRFLAGLAAAAAAITGQKKLLKKVMMSL